jgi:RNA-dependent RNA polymerase
MAVDYVKSGTPARMTSDLRPRKWPHFMEKEHKPAEQIYHSKKVLGQLYDQVDRVDFVPTFDQPFDKRILNAYKVSPEMLKDAAEVKLRYDAAMRRIMAQHDIKTEFEVWSTFVMQHSNEFRDYKFHEEIGNLSQSLKDQFRDECRQKISTENFEDMLGFVAAMYQITAQETDLALSECRQMVMVGGVETPLRKMVPSSMPFMSFPWLFPHYLGQIANGNFSISDAIVPAALQGQTKRTPPKKQPVDLEGRDMVLETAEGTTHRGENLILFDDWVDVHMDSQDQKVGLEAGSIPSLAGSVSDTNGSVHDLLAHEISFEDSYPGNRENGRLRSTASSSEYMSNSADIDRFGMRPSQLFRHAEADIGTLSRVLTPTSSETTSQGMQVSLDGKATPKHSTAGDSGYLSHDNRFSDFLGPAEATERKAEKEATPIMKPRVIGVKTADSRAKREKAGSMVEEDGLEVNEDDDDEVEEEVEVHLETKPSYIDRLSLLDID